MTKYPPISNSVFVLVQAQSEIKSKFATMVSTITMFAAPASTTTTSLASQTSIPSGSGSPSEVTISLPVDAFSGNSPTFAATSTVTSGTTFYDISCAGSACSGTSVFAYTPLGSDTWVWAYNATSVASGGLTSTIEAVNSCTKTDQSSAVCQTTSQAAATNSASIFGAAGQGQETVSITSYVVPIKNAATTQTGSGTTSAAGTKSTISLSGARKLSAGSLFGVALLMVTAMMA